MNTSCIIGPSGSGKSTLLRQRISDDPQYALLTSSTGISAVNLGEGVTTIHSALGFFDLRSLCEAHKYGRIKKKFLELAQRGKKNLVLDEVSMFSGDALQLVHDGAYEAAVIREDKGLASCGLVLTGDMCFGRGTPIMMADGSIRAIEEVRRGDRVMGSNNSARNVIDVCSGADELFLVRQTNGDNYVVNSKHRIVLKRNPNGSRMDWESGHRYPKLGDQVFATPLEWMGASCKLKSCFSGFKFGVVQLAELPIDLDPYFLGLWLGDGDSDACRITTPDPEIESYLADYAKANNLVITTTIWERTHAKRIALSGGKINPTQKRNPVWEAMKRLGLPFNKHIPTDYLLNSVDRRLTLLAGLIDSDGCWHDNRYSITFTRRELAHQTKQLADGLGFRAAIRVLTHGYYKNGDNGGAWTITIGGDTWRIPCRVERKKSVERNLGRSRLTSTLSVEPLGVGEYFGFETDGDHLFLLGDGTVAHNCQLSPVPDEPKQPVKYAFEAPCWGLYEQNMEHLTEIKRQTNHQFQLAMNLVRAGRGVDAAFELRKCGVEFVPYEDDSFDGITLFAVNAQVQSYNERRLAALPGEVVTIPSERWGKERSEWKQIPEKLELKDGALVMVLVNDSPEFRYVNGDLGTFHQREPGKCVCGCPSPDCCTCEGVHEVETKRGYTGPIPMIIRRNLSWAAEHSRENEYRATAYGRQLKMIEDSEGRSSKRWYAVYMSYLNSVIMRGECYYDPREQGTVIGEVKYMPLRVAYASTTHKTQGLTVDKAQIVINHHWFSSPGMAYVALSRVRSAEGLRIVGDLKSLAKRIVTDPRVKRWV